MTEKAAQHAHELFDVVDAHDRVVGRETRGFVHANNLRHRAVHILVYNSRGEVFLQKRSLLKDQLPGCWTTSCSGHVDSGEDYDTAAIRELREELGIGIESIDQLSRLAQHHACRETGMEFIRIYGLLWDGDMTLDEQEISEGRWLDPEDISDWIALDRRAFAPSFRLVWQRVREIGFPQAPVESKS